jgi:hypothetical protein
MGAFAGDLRVGDGVDIAFVELGDVQDLPVAAFEPPVLIRREQHQMLATVSGDRDRLA